MRDGPFLEVRFLDVGRAAWRATVERLLLGGLREVRLPKGSTKVRVDRDAPHLARLAGAIHDAAVEAGWAAEPDGRRVASEP